MCTDCGDTEQVKYSNTPNLKLVEQPFIRQRWLLQKRGRQGRYRP